MSYKDKYKDCKGCPVKDFCDMACANSENICSTMPTYEELEEKYDAWMEAGLVDPYDCC